MGLVLVVLGAVLVVAFVGGSSPTRQVLALARNVSKGEVLAAGDLTNLELPADAAIAALDVQSLASLVGRQAVSDLSAGTVLTLQLLAPQRELPAGMVVVGAQLDAGQYPVRHFKAGEKVNLLGRPPDEDRVVAVALSVEIYEVTQLGATDRLFISFLIPELQQLSVAEVLGDGSLRLGLLEAGA